MVDAKGPTAAATSNKLAMSRALGAAFLNHQVEQLEKSVSNGPSSGNWRDRRQAQADRINSNPRGGVSHGSKRPPQAPGAKIVRKKGGPEGEVGNVKSRLMFIEEPKRLQEKDADVVVVDASVLVHGLYQVRKWCKEGRDEVVIVPLEALNTLDLLKKGTSPLAQKARAASRMLEAQVGTNPRIRVQRDDAFVLWDSIPFKDLSDASASLPQHHAGSSPEWVRRTICCARWELDNAGKKDAGAPATTPKVILAILASSPSQARTALEETLTTDPTSEASPATSPVPLPVPNLHPNKFEPRSSGILVSHWAARAGISMFEVKPAQPPAVVAAGRHHVSGKISSDEERVPKKSHGHRGRRTPPGAPTTAGGSHPTGSGLVERPPAVMAMMEMVAQPSKVVRVLARGEKLDPDP